MYRLVFLLRLPRLQIYPNSIVTSLTMETSDHVPSYLVTISTDIQGDIFLGLKNLWLQHDDFINQVYLGWCTPFCHADVATNSFFFER